MKFKKGDKVLVDGVPAVIYAIHDSNMYEVEFTRYGYICDGAEYPQQAVDPEDIYFVNGKYIDIPLSKEANTVFRDILDNH